MNYRAPRAGYQQQYIAPPTAYSPGYEQYPDPNSPLRGYQQPPRNAAYSQAQAQQPYGRPTNGYSQPPYGGVAAPAGYAQPYGVQPQYSQQPYGAGPPSQYPQQQYGGFLQPQVGLSLVGQPSPGYDVLNPPNIPFSNFARDAQDLRDAMKGWGTNEAMLIKILANRGPIQIDMIRQAYENNIARNLTSDVNSETSFSLQRGLTALTRGPLRQDCFILREATDGFASKESLLIEVLLGRSNADMRSIKLLYQKENQVELEDDLERDVNGNLLELFLLAAQATRAEENEPVNPVAIDQDVNAIFQATRGSADEMTLCTVFTQRSNVQIHAINYAYKAKYAQDLEAVIKRAFLRHPFSHVKDALLYQIRTATDRAMRDAMLIEDAMAGPGTRDKLLVNRIIRCHWDPMHMQQVKGAWQRHYGKKKAPTLKARIVGETGGITEKHYQELMIECIELPRGQFETQPFFFQ